MRQTREMYGEKELTNEQFEELDHRAFLFWMRRFNGRDLDRDYDAAISLEEKHIKGELKSRWPAARTTSLIAKRIAKERFLVRLAQGNMDEPEFKELAMIAMKG